MTVIPKEAVGWTGNKFERDGGGSWLDLITGMRVRQEERMESWRI